jgi:hypothetical protein
VEYTRGDLKQLKKDKITDNQQHLCGSGSGVSLKILPKSGSGDKLHKKDKITDNQQHLCNLIPDPVFGKILMKRLIRIRINPMVLLFTRAFCFIVENCVNKNMFGNRTNLLSICCNNLNYSCCIQKKNTFACGITKLTDAHMAVSKSQDT